MVGVQWLQILRDTAGLQQQMVAEAAAIAVVAVTACTSSNELGLPRCKC